MATCDSILAITPLVRHIHLQSAKGMASLVYRFQRVIKLCLKNICLSISIIALSFYVLDPRGYFVPKTIL